MARKPKNANIDIRQTARAFDKQAFVDGVFNDDYIFVVGSGVILDRKQFSNLGGYINQILMTRLIATNMKAKSIFYGSPKRR